MSQDWQMIVTMIGANASTSCDVKASQHSELHSKAELWLLLLLLGLLLFLVHLQGEHMKEEKEQEEEHHSLALFVLTMGSIAFICQYCHCRIALRL
jgi:hypothetical protein